MVKTKQPHWLVNDITDNKNNTVRIIYHKYTKKKTILNLIDKLREEMEK